MSKILVHLELQPSSRSETLKLQQIAIIKGLSVPCGFLIVSSRWMWIHLVAVVSVMKQNTMKPLSQKLIWPSSIVFQNWGTIGGGEKQSICRKITSTQLKITYVGKSCHIQQVRGIVYHRWSLVSASQMWYVTTTNHVVCRSFVMLSDQFCPQFHLVYAFLLRAVHQPGNKIIDHNKLTRRI